MAFFRPFLTDPFFAPTSSLLFPSSSLLFDDEPFFSNTPPYLYDNTPSSRRRGGRNTVRPQQQQLKEQQAGSSDNAQAMVSGTTGSDDKDISATQPSSPSTKQTALTDHSNNDKAVNTRDKQQPRLLSPLSLLTPFNHAASLLSSRAALPSMSVDMMSTDKEYTVHASVPGVAKQDLKVTVEDGVLTIEAERREETKQSRRQQSDSPTSQQQKQQQSAGSPSSANGQKQGAAQAAQVESQGMDKSEHADEPQYHHVESFYGHVSRSITLPDDCNVDGMTAKYEDGVLRIVIPRVHDKRQRGTRLEIQ